MRRLTLPPVFGRFMYSLRTEWARLHAPRNSSRRLEVVVLPWRKIA